MSERALKISIAVAFTVLGGYSAVIAAGRGRWWLFLANALAAGIWAVVAWGAARGPRPHNRGPGR